MSTPPWESVATPSWSGCTRFTVLWLLLFMSVCASAANTKEDEELAHQVPTTSHGLDDNYFAVDNQPATNRTLASISSFLLPGLGQTYHRQYLKAAGHFGFFAANKVARRSHRVDQDRRSYAEKHDDTYIYLSPDSMRSQLYNSMAFSSRLYSSFDAYRSASILQGKAGGDVPISKESFSELALAPFTLRNLNQPLVLTPIFLLGTYYLAGGTKRGQDDDLNRFILDGPTKTDVAIHSAIQYEAVAIGEEAFYRGILNTELIRAFGVYPGIFLSSLLFGISHTGQGLSASTVTASTYGLYMGYMHHYHNYQLGPNLALHFWWNTIIHTAVTSNSKKFTIPLAYFTF